MIIIRIETNGDQIQDQFTKEKTTLQEVAVALLRLKQIEQELIDIEFDSDLECKEEH